MNELLSGMNLWESVAVVLAIAYLLLAMREHILCWYCALFSTAIYTVLLWNVSLLMESALNVYYMVMAGYGWWQWRRGDGHREGAQIRTLDRSWHGIFFLAIVLITAVNGYWLAQHTSAAWPYVDSMTAWASVIATWMVARKVLENWLYWIAIDAVSVFLYLNRGLYLTALLFMGYVVIAVFGYLAWRRHYLAGPLPAAVHA
jgi:nicotinamide mononucleotide transporter